jgi:RNA polymerase sigma factor (sigma-70 family)
MILSQDKLIEVLTACEEQIRWKCGHRLASLGARCDLDDLMQIVWTKANAGLTGCTAANEHQLRGWIMVIAKNACEDMVTYERGSLNRSTRREEVAIGVATDESRDGFQPAAGSADPAVAVAAREEADRMIGLLATLPKAMKQAVTLRFIEQKEFDEIAAEMGVLPESVRSLVSRGLAELRKLAA